MNIDVIAVGKLRESFYRDAAAEYLKRLSRYATVRVIEIEEEKKPDVIPDNLAQKIKQKEGERIMKAYSPRAYRCILDLRGKALSSEKLASSIDSVFASGYDTIQFVIGGAIGLSDEVVKSADLVLKCSELTFPHQLMRVILLEQIYRSFRIIRNEPYHK